MPEGGDGVDVAAADPGYPTRHEVPDGDTTIVAADSQLRPPPVEAAGEGLAARVQDAFIVLWGGLALVTGKDSN